MVSAVCLARPKGGCLAFAAMQPERRNRWGRRLAQPPPLAAGAGKAFVIDGLKDDDGSQSLLVSTRSRYSSSMASSASTSPSRTQAAASDKLQQPTGKPSNLWFEATGRGGCCLDPAPGHRRHLLLGNSLWPSRDHGEGAGDGENIVSDSEVSQAESQASQESTNSYLGRSLTSCPNDQTDLTGQAGFWQPLSARRALARTVVAQEQCRSPRQEQRGVHPYLNASLSPRVSGDLQQAPRVQQPMSARQDRHALQAGYPQMPMSARVEHQQQLGLRGHSHSHSYFSPAQTYRQQRSHQTSPSFNSVPQHQRQQRQQSPQQHQQQQGEAELKQHAKGHIDKLMPVLTEDENEDCALTSGSKSPKPAMPKLDLSLVSNGPKSASGVLVSTLTQASQEVTRPPTFSSVEAVPRKTCSQTALVAQSNALQGSPSISDLAALPEARRSKMPTQGRSAWYDEAMDKTKATLAWLSARGDPPQGRIMLPLSATQSTKLSQQEDHNDLSACSTNDSFEGQLTRNQSQGSVNASRAVLQPSRSTEASCQALASPAVGHAAASLKPLPIQRAAQGAHAFPALSPRHLNVSEAAVHPALLGFSGTPPVSPRGVPVSPRGLVSPRVFHMDTEEEDRFEDDWYPEHKLQQKGEAMPEHVPQLAEPTSNNDAARFGSRTRDNSPVPVVQC